ncbi:hypothetical protein EPO04_02905 [Patescibacteria group bacterium]|nr:MAG: hypothetical protein EPO04_02905 [Patescibacteria group bacterium]
MSARINLAPEVYQKHQSDKRNKRIAASVATITSIAVGGFVLVMLLILGAQKGAIALASNDIKSKQNEINNIPDLKKAVTAQYHLNSWEELVSKKVRISRFFAILEEFQPQGIRIAQIELSGTTLLKINGESRNYALVDKMVKAFEAANIEIGPNASSTNNPLFTQVTVNSASEEDGKISFELTAQLAEEVTNGN